MKSMNEWKSELLSKPELEEKYKKDRAIEEVIAIFLQYRKEHNLTQKELAEKIGATQELVYELEHKLINPSLKILVDSLDKMGYRIQIVKNNLNREEM